MEREAFEHTPQGIQKKKVSIAEEEYVTLFVNKIKLARIFASPENLNELGVGFLVSEGILEFKNIKEVSSDKKNIYVTAEGAVDVGMLSELRSSGCSGAVSEEPNPVESKKTFSRTVILKSIPLLNECSQTWRKTGGTHTACLISDKGRLVASFEDIGRHNALDKTVGWALLNKISLKDKFILFTGRISAGIVYKTARVSIPLLVSNTAALSKAVQEADKLNQTVIGFARGDKYTVYTNEWRIE